jgi:branched-chain amino acid transport system substrate-binding protein
MSAITRRHVTHLLSAVGALALGLGGPAMAQDAISIGGAFNLTGGQASMDGPAKNGAQLAIDAINAKGGVNGKPLKMIVYDAKTDSAVQASIGSQLLKSDKVPIIIGFSDSDPVLAVAPNAQSAGVPFLTVGATSPKLPDQVGNNMFLTAFGDNTQAAVGAAFAMQNLKAKTVYVIEDTGAEYTTLLSRYFREAFKHLGGEIIGQDTYRTGDKTFTAQITKVKALPKKPDFLFIAAQPAEVGLVVRQVRQSGITLPILGGDGFDTPLLVDVAGNAADNVFYTTHALISPESQGAVKDFYDAYKKAYNTEPENSFAALGYDSVLIVADALKRANSAEPAKIRDALQQTKDLSGVTGQISYTQESRVPVKGVTVVGIKDKKPFEAAKIVPTFVPNP